MTFNLVEMGARKDVNGWGCEWGYKWMNLGGGVESEREEMRGEERG